MLPLCTLTAILCVFLGAFEMKIYKKIGLSVRPRIATRENAKRIFIKFGIGGCSNEICEGIVRLGERTTMADSA